jgi:hypothetical protein
MREAIFLNDNVAFSTRRPGLLQLRRELGVKLAVSCDGNHYRNSALGKQGDEEHRKCVN